MQLSIKHRTVYEYTRPVTNSVNEVWMRPLTDERQSCLSFTLTTDPRSEPRPYTDYYGNTVYHFDVPEAHDRLTIVAEADVITQPFDLEAALIGDTSPVQPLSPADQDRWLDFLSPTPLTTPGPAIRAFAKAFGAGHASTAALVRALAERVNAALVYERGLTTVYTPAEEALQGEKGVCQDYTQVYIAVCRQLGIPARYVSGYVSSDLTLTNDENAMASHAWPEVLLPRTGWVGIDVTNVRLVDEQYVRVAVGRDYADVPPAKGHYTGPPSDDVDVAVFVAPEQEQQQQQADQQQAGRERPGARGGPLPGPAGHPSPMPGEGIGPLPQSRHSS